jgi:hypothetical protein
VRARKKGQPKVGRRKKSIKSNMHYLNKKKVQTKLQEEQKKCMKRILKDKIEEEFWCVYRIRRSEGLFLDFVIFTFPRHHTWTDRTY